MQVKFNDTQSFGKLRTNSNLMPRINTHQRYDQYQQLVEKMENCLVDCVLSMDEKGRLCAKFENASAYIPEFKENKMRAFFNLSPIKFIKKMCKIAEIFSNAK